MLALVSGRYPSGAGRGGGDERRRLGFHLHGRRDLAGRRRRSPRGRHRREPPEPPRRVRARRTGTGEGADPGGRALRRPRRSAGLDRIAKCRRRPRSHRRTRSTRRRSRSPHWCSGCCSSPSSRSAASPCSRSAGSARSACSSRSAPPTAMSVSSSAPTASSSVWSARSSDSCSGSSSGSPTGRASSRAHTTSSLSSPCRGSWSARPWCWRSSAAYFAASRPARAITRVPIVAALSGRPAPPRQIHRSAIPGIVFFVIAFLLLGYSGSTNGGNGSGGAPGLVFGLVLPHPRAHPARAVLPDPRRRGSAVGRRSPPGSHCATSPGTAPARVRRWRRSASGSSSRSSLSSPRRPVTGTSSTTRDRTSPRTNSPSTLTYHRPEVRSLDPAATAMRPPSRSARRRAATPAQLAAHAAAIAKGLGAQLIALETPNAGLDGHALGRSWDGAVYVATPQLLSAFGITAVGDRSERRHLELATRSPGVSGLGLDYASG